MTTFYSEDSDRFWSPTLTVAPWRVDRSGRFFRICYTGELPESDRGVAIVAGMTHFGQNVLPFDDEIRLAGNAAAVRDVIAGHFWRLALALPSQGYQDVLRAMPQRMHPPTDSVMLDIVYPVEHHFRAGSLTCLAKIDGIEFEELPNGISVKGTVSQHDWVKRVLASVPLVLGNGMTVRVDRETGTATTNSEETL